MLNSDADKDTFDYSYIYHRFFRYGNVYWIMKYQLQDLEVNEDRSLMKFILYWMKQ